MTHLFTAVEERDAAIAAAAQGAGQAWMTRAQSMLAEYLDTAGFMPFVASDFRAWATARGLPNPAEPRSYGAVFQRASKSGLIAGTGMVRKTERRESHCRPEAVWRKA